jgi:hypothetical protein
MRRGSHGIDSDHDLLVGNCGVCSTLVAPRREQGMASVAP